MGEEEEEEAEQKWMNKGDVYFRGQSCSVHLKIGFVSMERERERERDKERRRWEEVAEKECKIEKYHK